MWGARDNRIFAGLLLALIAVAWSSLILWDVSPYARFLNHRALDELALGSNYGLLVVFVAGWTLMTAAMMLPTSLPLLLGFRRMLGQRREGGRLVALLIVGYLTAWTTFGVLVHLADLMVHRAVDVSPWLERDSWLIMTATIVGAGIFQFSRLKYRCLDQCRSPLSFLVQHWSGRRDGRAAFTLGMHHGAFCIGCCWALMLLMFAVGTGSIGWMLVLGAIMATEKNMPWGRRLSTPLGIGLLGLGAGLALVGLTGHLQVAV